MTGRYRAHPSERERHQDKQLRQPSWVRGTATWGARRTCRAPAEGEAIELGTASAAQAQLAPTGPVELWATPTPPALCGRRLQNPWDCAVDPEGECGRFEPGLAAGVGSDRRPLPLPTGGAGAATPQMKDCAGRRAPRRQAPPTPPRVHMSEFTDLAAAFTTLSCKRADIKPL